MPQKEHLTFESTTPAFLRRLRGEVPSGPSGSSTDPDRHAIPQVRARRPRDAADEDDEPVYVDAGTGQTLSSGEIKEMKQDEGKDDVLAVESKISVDDSKEVDSREKAAVKTTMGVGHSKKKREIPVVSGNDKRNAKDDRDGEESVEQSSSKDSQEKPSKLKRKAKKIKLSFDDDQ